ncbi:hypothetical protein EJV47_19610 [Hymenobacter gummosus]|uniref:Uncharacterized protein n=1 Tax=Hymenobacter gummosus TaxID=1776032 RepID=A0A3S0HKV4_9BACT|nr:hypothetical protein [Hymenobacter gummosus]RTQ47106.1 hypothetical protein EJV47_19610 [Hymenobacter gummosus]
MSTRSRCRWLFVAGWAAATLGPYVALFGSAALTMGVDVQMHNTYFVVGPAGALQGLALLLTPLVGAVYLLIMRRLGRTALWVIGLLALLLIYLCGGLIEALAQLAPVAHLREYPGGAAGQAPVGSSLLRLIPGLRLLQVLFGLAALLAGRALGRRSPQTSPPDFHL